MTVRHPLMYMHHAEAVALGELQERARQHGEIVLGIVDRSANGVVMINKQAIVRHCGIKSLIALCGWECRNAAQKYSGLVTLATKAHPCNLLNLTLPRQSLSEDTVGAPLQLRMAVGL